MTVLVAYASRHGSTAEIAGRIAATLTEAGVPAEARPVAEVTDVAGYDAYVVGSAAYMFHWLREATAFVKRHRRRLSERPVWLFSSGPLGTDLVDDTGRDLLEVMRPKEFDELGAMIDAQGDQVFFGSWDPQAPAIGLAERFVRRMATAENAMPAGDFRDWPAIDAWARTIAAALRAEAPIPR